MVATKKSAIVRKLISISWENDVKPDRLAQDVIVAILKTQKDPAVMLDPNACGDNVTVDHADDIRRDEFKPDNVEPTQRSRSSRENVSKRQSTGNVCTYGCQGVDHVSSGSVGAQASCLRVAGWVYLVHRERR